MRLVHIHLGIKGGAERFFVNLVNSLAERGVQQKALIWPDRVWRDEISDVCDVHEINFSRSHVARFFINRKIRRLLHEFKADAIVSWMPQASRWIPADSRLLTAARLGDYPEKLDYFENCDVLICNTPDIARHCESIGWTRKLSVISNFTNTKPVAPIERQQLDTPEDAYVVMGMGRFVDRKGFDTLIRAVAQLDPKTYLWLLGEGEEIDALKELAVALGVDDRVRFIGWVNDPSPYLAAADAFCIPSRHEPLGNVVLEAWAMEKPVVTTASEGPTWLIEDEVQGLVVPIDDDRALSGALARLRDDAEFSARLVANGKSRLEQEFSKSAITGKYMDLIANGRDQTK